MKQLLILLVILFVGCSSIPSTLDGEYYKVISIYADSRESGIRRLDIDLNPNKSFSLFYIYTNRRDIQAGDSVRITLEKK